MSTGAARVLLAARALRAAVRDFDPSVLTSGAQCAEVADELAAAEKACGAVRVLAAARAVACGAHKDAGVADPLRWVASQAGTTGRDAKDALGLARALGDQPEVKAALLQGEVSLAQAKEIARAQAESPGQAHQLLEVARGGDLGTLRDAIRDQTLASTPPGELHRRQLAARRFRHWRDGLGMVCFDGALAPETGIPFVTRIERAAARCHKEAKRSGAQERFEAYAADALVEMAKAKGGPARGPNTDLVIVCDLLAWRRGHTHEAEPCHIVGGGPIPLEVAKELSEDAFFKIVLHDGVDIQRITHVGRRYTAELRTALDLGPVPAFSGRACAECRRTWGLQRDHDDPVAHQGPTSYANVQDLCYPCHLEKTERDRLAGLLGPRAKATGPRTRTTQPRQRTAQPQARTAQSRQRTTQPTPRPRPNGSSATPHNAGPRGGGKLAPRRAPPSDEPP